MLFPCCFFCLRCSSLNRGWEVVYFKKTFTKHTQQLQHIVTDSKYCFWGPKRGANNEGIFIHTWHWSKGGLKWYQEAAKSTIGTIGVFFFKVTGNQYHLLKTSKKALLTYLLLVHCFRICWWEAWHNFPFHDECWTQLAKAFAQKIKMIPTLAQNQFDMFLVGFSLLRIMINPDKSQAKAKGDWLETRTCVIGYRWNCLDEPIYLVRLKPLVSRAFIMDWTVELTFSFFQISAFWNKTQSWVPWWGGDKTGSIHSEKFRKLFFLKEKVLKRVPYIIHTHSDQNHTVTWN